MSYSEDINWYGIVKEYHIYSQELSIWLQKYNKITKKSRKISNYIIEMMRNRTKMFLNSKTDNLKYLLLSFGSNLVQIDKYFYNLFRHDLRSIIDKSMVKSLYFTYFKTESSIDLVHEDDELLSDYTYGGYGNELFVRLGINNYIKIIDSELYLGNHNKLVKLEDIKEPLLKLLTQFTLDKPDFVGFVLVDRDFKKITIT